MQESEIEHYLLKQIAAQGGITRKLQYQGRTGAPDRLCLLPNGTALFVECKAPGKRPRKDQLVEMAALRAQRQIAVWVDSKEDIDELIEAALCV